MRQGRGVGTIGIYINVGKEGLQLSQGYRAASLLHACLQLIHCDAATVVCIHALHTHVPH